MSYDDNQAGYDISKACVLLTLPQISSGSSPPGFMVTAQALLNNIKFISVSSRIEQQKSTGKTGKVRVSPKPTAFYLKVQLKENPTMKQERSTLNTQRILLDSALDLPCSRFKDK